MDQHTQFHRRRNDPKPAVTIIHAAPRDCPTVERGETTRCPGHRLPNPMVSGEGPMEHMRNALQLVRLAMDFGEPYVAYTDGPAVITTIELLNGIQRRLEAAVSLIEEELHGAACCVQCGGTILAPTANGVPRGTCYCPRSKP